MQQPLSSIMARAEKLLEELKPQVVEALEKMGPEQIGLTFDQIEAQSAAIGDLLARVLMHEATDRQSLATDSEIEKAKGAALAQAGTKGAKLSVEKLRVQRIRGKPCTLATVRGPVPLEREYLYFPELQAGIFPPRRTPGHSSG